MLLLLRFVPDEWDPAAIVGEYRDRLVTCPSWRPDGEGDFAADAEVNEVPFAGVAVRA